MTKRKRVNSKGFTLVEIVVALCVAAVLFSSMIAVMAPVYRIYARTRERSDAQLVAGVVLDSIRATCSTAGTLAVDGNKLTVGGTKEFFIEEDGYLMFGDVGGTGANAPERVLAEGVYNGKKISRMSCEQVAGQDNTVRLTLTVTGGDGAECTLVSTISPLRAVMNTPHT